MVVVTSASAEEEMSGQHWSRVSGREGLAGRGDWTKHVASQWQGMMASMRRRSLLKEEHLEKAVTRSAEVHLETGSLGSLCRQFQRRLPLRAVSLNLGTGPSWKRLETPEPKQQHLKASAHSAKSALGATSQRIQESCQSGTRWLMGTQVKVRKKREVQKDRGSSPPSLSQKNTRLYRANLGARVGGHPRLSGQMGLHAHQRQRLRREADLRSPCSSTEPLCSPSESDSDLEPVGAGIQHLQKLSQKLDKAIKAEESGDMTVSLIRE
ncbi:protein PIMREG-like [Peromyscus californicus insignis]|uniref:protein PIMREG-like n=1 Tax=Peromyscus californicus insignis TaxID=564181 RepID=UPI0022A69094|nr:protein PIMREG-like [Peromyscus californicus insignis]